MAQHHTVSITSASASAVAGYCAGVTGVVIGHPLDSMKVWMQTNSIGKNKHMAAGTVTANTSRPATMGAATTRPDASVMRSSVSSAKAMSTLSPSAYAIDQNKASKMVRYVSNTARALYSGVSGPLISVGIVQSINFTTYDAMRRILHSRDHPNNTNHREYLNKDSMKNVAISGFVSGIGLAFITSPLIMIKTKQQITGNGFRQALKESLFNNGRLSLKGCFTGFYPHLISETMGRSLYYVVYEASKRAVASYKEQKHGVASTEVSLHERMLCAAFAGISCWAVIYPFDVLRSRLYYQEGRVSTVDMIKRVHAEKAFYRGFTLTVLRAGPVAAAVLPVYDLVLERLSV